MSERGTNHMGYPKRGNRVFRPKGSPFQYSFMSASASDIQELRAELAQDNLQKILNVRVGDGCDCRRCLTNALIAVAKMPADT